MILESLGLSNFKSFSGEHLIDLKPRIVDGKLRNVVLFGGLNGAGKTTILTAIRLGMFGRASLEKMPSKDEYTEYLQKQINIDVLAADPAAVSSIELTFSHANRGVSKVYALKRCWAAGEADTVTLSMDGEIIPNMSAESIQQFIKEIVPPGVGDLFFFDGEKIAKLAQDDTGAYLKEAVHKLLGLDLLGRLEKDLDIYINEAQKNSADHDVLRKIEVAQQQQQLINEELQPLMEEVERLLTPLEEIKEQIKTKKKEIDAFSPEHSKERAQAAEHQQSLINKKRDLQSEIRAEKSMYLPLALASTSMKKLLDQLAEDQQIKQAQSFGNQLIKHMGGLSDVLQTKFAEQSGHISASINAYFGRVINETALSKPKIDISDADFALLRAHYEEAESSLAHCRDLESSLLEVEGELSQLAYTAQQVPDSQLLTVLYGELTKLMTEKEAKSKAFMTLLAKVRDLKEKELSLAVALEKHFATLKNKSSTDKAQKRVSLSLNVLSELKKELVLLRVSQLQTLFVESYRKLTRKSELDLSATVDPVTYDVHLIDANGVVIDRSLLSAGERQIFAVALLESLGKLSNKMLPVVIDTPLGRLDSHHRQKLVRHYFPEASAQVILLSTDTEIDQDFYKDMASSLSHSYQINFDQQTKCASVVEGYFWHQPTKELYREAV